MTRLARTLALIALIGTTGCKSMRLLADPQRGFEGDGPRSVSLAFDRMTLELAPQPEGPALSVEGNGRPAPTVRLPLRAANETATPWELHLEDFDVAHVDHRDEQLPPPHAWSGQGTVLVLVPAGGSARFELPLRLPLGASESNGRYRLRCHVDGPDGRVTILERDLVLDHFSPLRQIVYASGFALILLGISVTI